VFRAGRTVSAKIDPVALPPFKAAAQANEFMTIVFAQEQRHCFADA
jgi:hypothetical protein